MPQSSIFSTRIAHERKIPEWERTENCQRHYEENDDSEWDHPLQFALAVILASQDKPITSLEPAKMYSRAKSVLLQTSSPNGLLAGKLDSDQNPGIFDEKETHQSYWSASFEVPYILWKYQQRQGELSSTSSQDPSTEASRQPSSMLQERTTSRILHKLPQVSDHLDRIGLPSTTLISKEDAIKQSIPFGNSIDQSNIVERSDDWLYDEPTFFTFHQDPGGRVLQDFCKQNKYGSDPIVSQAAKFVRHDAAHGTRHYSDQNVVEGIILDVRTDYLKASRNGNTDNNRDPMMRTLEHREDANAPNTRVPESQSKSYSVTRIKNDAALRSHLSLPRTRANAKKRVLQFFRAKKTTALLCYLASSERERLSAFFDRHASYERYFFDDATTALNSWVTELHLPFYRLSEKTNSTQNSDATAHSGSNDFPLPDEIEIPLPGNDQKMGMRRAVMSFRFDGDIFDRYWTCHIVEYDRAGTRNTEEQERDIRFSIENDHWKQRKVLELNIFDRILEHMLGATQYALQVARTCVWGHINGGDLTTATGKRKSALEDALNLLSAENNDTFLSTSMLCHTIQYLLQAVQNDLSDNLLTVQAWSDRERARGADRPRWTQKDEQRYRSTLSKWQASTELKILELNRCHANISSYSSSLTKKLEDIRSELELRGADDIRLFTYVTAVFLPIGFATGLFSMSEPPSGITLGAMAGTACTALILTLIALVNAKFLRKSVFGPIIRGCATALHSLFDLMKHGFEPKKQSKDGNNSKENPSPNKIQHQSRNPFARKWKATTRGPEP